MRKILYFLRLLIITKIYSQFNSCMPGINHCKICNPLTGLCFKCENENYIIDDEGGCDHIKTCRFGYNNCLECSKEKKDLCIKCEIGFFPDESGGCSYTKNCILSERGKCFKCKENYVLIGIENDYHEGIKICKSIFSDDLKFCEIINENNGLCDKCNEGYFLNPKDKKCSTKENCDDSSFGICTKCLYGYYLDKKVNECKRQKDNFMNCKETIDGENCYTCDNLYYFDEDGKCIYNNYCLKEKSLYRCGKCIDNYFLTGKDDKCTPTQNCEYADRTTGECAICKDNYYIDYKDGICKSNIEENDFKYCKIADEVCIECIGSSYFIGNDNKCTTTRFCLESYNTTCLECIDNYYLGFDHRCTNIKHCIYSDNYNYCIECEGDYYYNRKENLCKIGEGDLEHCKINHYTENYCEKCKDDYYLNLTNHLCYSNQEQGDFYKCAMSSNNDDYCLNCIKGYYLSYIDNRCIKVEGCLLSENEDRCLECANFYCLDLKTGKCEYNYIIEDEKQIFYFRCKKTNKEGTACQICIDGFEVNKNGLCVNDTLCEEKNGDICKKCIKDEENYCLNEIFGCVNIDKENCLECNDNINLDFCTKCLEGYELNSYGRCIEIKKD